MRIISNTQQATDNKANYILVPPNAIDVCETIINEHKTGAIYEPLVKKLSSYLSNIIWLYITSHNLKNGDFLLGKSPLTRYESKMSNEIGMKGVTINTLLHMAVPKYLSVPSTLEERQQLAKEFGHSLRVQEDVCRGRL